MIVDVFVQNEAGSNQKHYHDEKTLVYLHSRTVASRYPFPYWFIIGTEAADGANLDCFVVTKGQLSTGTIVQCEAIGLMEQFEDGVGDHNVLAVPAGEIVEINAELQAALTDHVLRCFQKTPGKHVSVGKFLNRQAAEEHVAAHRTR